MEGTLRFSHLRSPGLSLVRLRPFLSQRVLLSPVFSFCRPVFFGGVRVSGTPFTAFPAACF